MELAVTVRVNSVPRPVTSSVTGSTSCHAKRRPLHGYFFLVV